MPIGSGRGHVSGDSQQADQREYADREIPEDVVRRILDAGRIAGSAVNRQPWRFVVLADPGLKAQVAGTLYVPTTVLGAKLAVALVVEGSPGFDAGRAAQNMMLAAWNEGITSCPNGMSDNRKTSDLLGLGEDEHVLNVLAFGYPRRPRDPEKRSAEDWIARAKRKPFEEVVEVRS